MRTLKRDLKENIIYLALWIIMFVAPLLGEYIQSSQSMGFGFNWDVVFDIWRVFAAYFVIFLIHNFLVAPLLIYRQKRGRYLLMVGVLVALFVAIQCSFHPGEPRGPRGMEHEAMGMEQPFDHHPGPPPHDHPVPPAPDRREEPPSRLLNGDMLHTFVIVFLLGMNLGVKLYFKNERDSKKMQQLKSRNLEQQLDRLRYQLNPHFFMNTLNNIHALIDIDAAKAKTTIVDLSRLMRYVLYEGAKPTVPLQRDIAFMNDYLQLMKIRYADGVRITASFPTDTPDTEIPPMLFISFIENAFKHGISYKHNSFIDIRLYIKAQRICFTCNNSTHVQKGDTHQGGVGLTNVRQRLDLLYPDNYKLDIQKTASEYRVSMSIPFSSKNLKPYNLKPETL